MNYHVAMNEVAGRRGGGRRDSRPRGNTRNGGGILGRLPFVIGVDAIIEHAGIARSVRFMARNFHTPIRVADLMVVAGLSRRGFLKSFRKHTGCAPGEWLRRMRIEHAKRLLAGRDVSLVELAAAAGFRKTNSFSVAFKRVTGMAPMKYQQRVQAELAGRARRASRRLALSL